MIPIQIAVRARPDPHLFVTESGCICGKSKYVEFNSDALTPGRSRRIRLYQVAALVGSRRYYEGVSREQIQAWIRENKIEASHRCRYIDYEQTPVLNADGSYSRVPIVRENKRCFNPDHMILEQAALNASRIACAGGEFCRHDPPCIVVVPPPPTPYPAVP